MDREPVRARARMLIPHEEIAETEPQEMAEALKKRCAEAKTAIIGNLKATLAGLEAAS